MRSMQIFRKKTVKNNQISERGEIVSRVFTDLSGRKFLLTFLLTRVNGEIKGRLISAEPISSHSVEFKLLTGEVAGANFFLPLVCPDCIAETEYLPSKAPSVSPYLELFFFNSQPTRAPSIQQ